MKLEITKTTTKFIEVELPIFKKHSCHYYKVFSEEKCIQICNLQGNESVSINSSSLAFSNENNKNCSEKEFIEQMEKVIKKIKSHT